MIAKRYKNQIESTVAELPSRLPLTQFVGSSNKFALILRGGFYLPEIWNGGEIFWLSKNGEILIDCPLPEALIKLSFRIIPAKNLNVKLSLSQGAVLLRKDVIKKPEQCNLYVSLLQGINPIACDVEGEVLSPSEACGEPDARKLSFAFQNLLNIELLA